VVATLGREAPVLGGGSVVGWISGEKRGGSDHGYEVRQRFNITDTKNTTEIDGGMNAYHGKTRLVKKGGYRQPNI
jgi:hypothetical protein